MTARPFWTLIFVALLSLSTTSVAHAFEDDVAKAAKAYRQAQQAELTEEFALASDLYQLAYQLAPSAPALRGAMRMSLKSERWVNAAEQAGEMLRKYSDDESSRDAAQKALDQTRPLVAEVAVSCGDAECNVLVDGKAATLEAQREHVVYLDAGRHEIAGGYAMGTSEAVGVNTRAGGSAKVELVAPAPRPEVARGFEGEDGIKGLGSNDSGSEGKPTRRTLSPWYFGVTAAATVGVTAGAIVSGVQAQQAGQDFEDGGNTQSLYDTANRLEIRTNALFGVAGGLAVATVVLAIFTDWKGGGKRKRAKVTSGPGTAGLGMVLDF
jgi:hypothetical protein